MPLPGKKASTPFKTMDIKTAFFSSGKRKRRAPSPQFHENESKMVKLSDENDIEILQEACGITIALANNKVNSCSEDVEGKSNNIVKAKSLVTHSKENQSVSEGELAININSSCNGLPGLETSHSDDHVDADEHLKESDNSSFDELNNSVNISLNTSEMDVTGEDENVNMESIANSKSKLPEKDVKEKIKKKRMTAAEAQKKSEERLKRQEEKMQKKLEIENKKRQRLLEKEQRTREKQLQKEREEMERKERERIKQEKKEQEEKEKQQRLKEKEEKLKIKQMILEIKLEQKKKKEEMKQKKEEELKKAEEEKLKLKSEKEQKEKEKKERAKAAFVKFFVKSDASTTVPPIQAAEKEGAFLPFQVSEDMTLAPVIPPAAQERFNKNQLNQYLKHQDGKELYLEILKSGSYRDVRQRKKERKLPASEADVIVIDKNAQAELGLCPKLLQFCENVRPPYWGTWRKKSKNVGPKRPFGQDEIFDYSVDSDDEWDEGGPGESLSGTDQEDVESEDEYEVDNEFFVPHGYLSDEEEKKEDDEEEVNDPEKQKALLKLKLQQFEMERKKKTTELKPIVLGCYFDNDSVFQDSGLQLFLQTYSAELLSESPIPTSFTVKSLQTDNGNGKNESPKCSSNSSTKKRRNLPDEAFPPLIRLVHGNTKNRRILAEEFQRFWTEQCQENLEVKEESKKPLPSAGTDPLKETELPSDSAQLSLRQLNHAIREIASYGKSPDSGFNKYCWWVQDTIRAKYGLLDAPIPNQWKYVSQKEQVPVKVNSASIKEFLSSN